MDDVKKAASSNNAVDKGTHDDVIRLDQKLKGLLVEVQTKIDALEHETNQSVVNKRLTQLTTLSGEVEKALVNIKQLVGLVVGEDTNASQARGRKK
jgi:hypothetical protein